MSETNASARQRNQNADYLMVGGSYQFMGMGFTKLDDSPAAATKKKRYINMVSESTNIAGYAWTAPFTFDQIDSQVAIAYMVRIGKEEIVGAGTETSYVSVDLLGEMDTATEDAESRGYPARRRRVAVEVSGFTDSDGEIEGSGNLLAKGDWEYGWFDTTGRAFTLDPAAKNNFAYAKALSAGQI